MNKPMTLRERFPQWGIFVNLLFGATALVWLLSRVQETSVVPNTLSFLGRSMRAVNHLSALEWFCIFVTIKLVNIASSLDKIEKKVNPPPYDPR